MVRGLRLVRRVATKTVKKTAIEHDAELHGQKRTSEEPDLIGMGLALVAGTSMDVALPSATLEE